MLARMPKYGAANVNHLIKPLDEVDIITPVEAIQFADTPAKVKTSGRLLVGSKALGCIKCHTFNNQKAEGIQALDLTSMPQRLKRDWFQRYMLDPNLSGPGPECPHLGPWVKHSSTKSLKAVLKNKSKVFMSTLAKDPKLHP